MHNLVVVDTWDAVAPDVSPILTVPLRRFQATLRSSGIRKVQGSGKLRHDCPPAKTVGAGKDCFVYTLLGRQLVPAGGVVTTKSRFRLWPEYTDGQWQVVNYDYDLLPSAS